MLEDVHRADEATLAVLALIGRRIRSSQGLVIATYRDDELCRAHPLTIVPGELAAEDSVNASPWHVFRSKRLPASAGCEVDA